MRRVLTILGLTPRAWKALAVALLCWSTLSSAQAASAVQTVFTNYGCSGCHSAPPDWISNNASALDAFATGRTFTLGGGARTACTAAGTSDPGGCFKTWIAQVGNAEGSPMSTLASDLAPSNGANDATALGMGQYVLNLIQGGVSPTSRDFGSALDGSTLTQVVTLQNYRAANAPFAMPTLAAPFSVANQDCPTDPATHDPAVPGTASLDTPGSCSLLVTFHPTSAAGTLGPLSPTLSISFVADTNGAQAPGPVSWNASSSSYSVAPVHVALAGAGYGIPQAQASVTAPSTVAPGDAVQLVGSANPSPNQGFSTLQYLWHFTGPAAIADSALASPQVIAPSTPGTYTAQLTVYDTYATLASATTAQKKSVTFTVVGRPSASLVVSPAAPPYYVGATITFDASGSHPQGSGTLNYLWNISPVPTVGQWTIDVSNTKAYFTPADARQYTVSVAVDDQGITPVSQPAPIVFTTQATNPPTASILNPVRTVLVNSPVTLAATAHTDNGALTCTWSVTPPSGPPPTVTPGSSNGTGCSASFTPGTVGAFVVGLTVSDGFRSTTLAAPAATITASNLEVNVDAGADQSVILNSPVVLAGAATSAIGDTLTTSWSMLSVPPGSNAAISPAASLTAGFTPDVLGTYIVQLSATDQHGHTAGDSATLTVRLPLSANATGLPFTAALGSSTTASTNVTNNTGGALAVQTVSFGGTTPGDFALDAANNTCVASLSLASGGSCRLSILFTPTDVGPRNATVQLGYPGAFSPLSITLLGTATPRPKGTVSSTDWAPPIADTVIGSSSVKTVVLSNSSSPATGAPLTFASFALAGAAAADYQVGGTCAATPPPTLAPGGQCQLTFTFAPSATGTRAASLQIASDASNALVSVTLGGKGLPAPAPALGLSPTAVNFGQQTVGGSYPAQSATLTNTGTATLVISNITVAGTGFAIVDASACTGASLVVGASCQVSVGFNPPSVLASFTGTLTIASNVPGAPTTLGLIGGGTAAAAPVLAWSPSVPALDFGTVQAGAISTTQSIVLANQGPGGAMLGFFNAVGVGSSAFTIDKGSCPTTQPLFAGSSCRLDITFAPSSSGPRSATLQVVSNGSAPAPVTLTGTGTGSPSLALALSTAAIDFRSVQLGTRSQPAMLRLSNSGAGNLQIAAIGATGAFSVSGASCPPAPFTLQSGAECTVAVTFEPTTVGAATGKVTVQSDAQSQPGDVALAGNGDAAPDLSSGGCSISRGDGPADPVLWTLAVLAALALAWRSRQRRRDARAQRERT